MPLKNLLLYLAAGVLALAVSTLAVLNAYAALMEALSTDSASLAVAATILVTATSLGTLTAIMFAAGRAVHAPPVIVFATVFFLAGGASIPYAFLVSVTNACYTGTSFPITSVGACRHA